MSPYDSRGLTLDPGLTALALRGLREPDGHYPFIDRFRARRRSGPRSAGGRAPHPVSRLRQALQWCGVSRRSVAAA
jgi:hypothetical protein